MESSSQPDLALAKRVLPKPLLECIENIFAQKIRGTALVGGTALAGFYAGHRQSDDIDLFSSKESHFREAVLAVKYLSKLGASLSEDSHSAQYFRATCTHRNHNFTIDVVLDENIHRVGKFVALPNGVVVADTETLFRMKVATLVSRTAEKDLYDIRWLFEKFPRPTSEWIKLGQSIDGGVNAENLLYSVAQARIRKEACNFSLKNENALKIYEEVLDTQKKLIVELKSFLANLPIPPLGKLVKKLKT